MWKAGVEGSNIFWKGCQSNSNQKPDEPKSRWVKKVRLQRTLSMTYSHCWKLQTEDDTPFDTSIFNWDEQQQGSQERPCSLESSGMERQCKPRYGRNWMLQMRQAGGTLGPNKPMYCHFKVFVFMSRVSSRLYLCSANEKNARSRSCCPLRSLKRWPIWSFWSVARRLDGWEMQQLMAATVLVMIKKNLN